MIKHSCLIALIVCFCCVYAHADVGEAAGGTKRGLVTTARCPYGCKDAGIEKRFCRERKKGDICEVEDLSQAPGHRTLIRAKKTRAAGTKHKAAKNAQTWRDVNGTWIRVSNSGEPALNKRGLITTARCPYTCAYVGLSRRVCREWKVGNQCSVEDLTQAPGHRVMFRAPKK